MTEKIQSKFSTTAYKDWNPLWRNVQKSTQQKKTCNSSVLPMCWHFRHLIKYSSLSSVLNRIGQKCSLNSYITHNTHHLFNIFLKWIVTSWILFLKTTN